MKLSLHIFLVGLILSLNHQTTIAQPFFLYHDCTTPSTFTSNSAYEQNLNTLLSRLAAAAGTSTNGYGNSTVGESTSNAVYGVFFCRGDINNDTCSACVSYAIKDRLNRADCPSRKTVLLGYEECTLHYSDQSIFSKLQLEPSFPIFDPALPDVSDPTQFADVLRSTVASQLIPRAVAGGHNKRLAVAKAPLDTEFWMLYVLAQCTPDLSDRDCKECLTKANETLPQGKQEGRAITPSCYIRFDVNLFYKESAVAWADTPANLASMSPPSPPDRAPPPASPVTKPHGTIKVLRITLATSISFLILILGSFTCYIYRKTIIKGAKDIGQDLLLFDLEMTNKRHMSQVESNNDNKKGIGHLPLPMFSLSSVFSVTNNFSTSNKLGEGGFGPVYKGELHNGQEVAVKRLSKHSGQGLDELINEAKLIAELQHTNLVRLLGYCIQKDEKILIYEYMPNKSLDFFLFDKIKKKMLDWSRRMCIIEGIAQGLLYLHQYARLRIIHRDLKASNILLDAHMKPKISDFGMARIFGRNQLQGNTKHIVGTFGYMPPEYALEGLFSIKTDVFSFGVLLLEILSGERNTSIHHEDCLNLIGYAWKLWIDDTPLELLDPILKTSCDLSIALRYIHVGLLCVQEYPDDRPSILDIVAMIGDEMKVIEVQPKQPAYVARRRTTLEVQPERFSLNELTCSTIHPR